MIVDKIKAYLETNGQTLNQAIKAEVEKLAGYSFERQFMTQETDVSPGKLRLSASGKCARQLAYGYHGLPVEGKEMDARAKVIFFQGDVVELMLASLARLAGCNLMATGIQQPIVEVKVTDTFTAKGHADGLLLYNEELILVEFKSMSSYGYERFERGEVDESYLAQANMYMKGLSLRKVLFVAVNKDSGVMHELLFERNEGVIDLTMENMRYVIESLPEALPKRPYTTDKKGNYPWQCAYCRAYKTCLIDPGLATRVVERGAYKLRSVNAKIDD